MTVKAKEIREEKKLEVQEIKSKLDSSKIMILTDFRGMTVKQITELRRKLRENNAEYRIFKNTLVVKALPQKLDALKDRLHGPVAILFGFDDVVLPAKALVKFISDNEKPGILCGVLEDKVCKDSEIKELAKLPGKQELLARVVSGLNAPIYGFVSVLNGPIRKLVYALNAVKDQKGGEK